MVLNDGFKMKKFILLVTLLFGCSIYDNIPDKTETKFATEATTEVHSIFVLEFRKYNYYCWISNDIIERDENNDIYLSYENEKYNVYIINKNLRYINFDGDNLKQAGRYLGIKIEDCMSED